MCSGYLFIKQFDHFHFRKGLGDFFVVLHQRSVELIFPFFVYDDNVDFHERLQKFRYCTAFCYNLHHKRDFYKGSTVSDIQLGIYPLHYEQVTDPAFLWQHIYPNMLRNYYWSDDFSPEYYIAQAQAGFIAVTDIYQGMELLLPEIQFSYALLHYKHLHTSKKVGKLLDRGLGLTVTSEIDAVCDKIRSYHKNCWLTPAYQATLNTTKNIDADFQILSAYIEEEGEMIAGEVGYIIGESYTSLSGFSNCQKRFRNYGTAQLVLLAHFLHEQGIDFWNLGQSYMPYKFALGAVQYEREAFLKEWFKHTR